MSDIQIGKYDDDSYNALKIVKALIENRDYKNLENILSDIIDNECFNQKKIILEL